MTRADELNDKLNDADCNAVLSGDREARFQPTK
jgi:hypothetical protein